MISIESIKTSHEKYDFVENLLTSAFPKEERRELDLQRKYTDDNPLFHTNIIWHEEKPVGFITYWDFNDFYYIEHFAISPDCRNGGYGQKVLTRVDELLTKPIALEVELPTTELSSRRIGFYSRLGYKLWEKEYKQPPYRKGDEFLPMYIMVKGELDPEKDFEKVRDKLYKEVYNVDAK